MTDHLIEDYDDGIATLTMNRPEVLNALSGEMQRALVEAARRLAVDPKVRAVVLTGAGRAFCAGGDVRGFVSRDSDPETAPTFEDKVNGLRSNLEFSRIMHEMPKPTLAVIPGAVAGGGFGMALSCDMRIAAENAKLTTVFARIAGSGDYGSSYFLSKLVGAAKARELFFLAEAITGSEAAALGIVNRAVPADELAAEARLLARRLADQPTIALGYMKKNLAIAERGSLADVLDAEALHMVRCMETEDHKAASLAFVEKRAPRFRGR